MNALDGFDAADAILPRRVMDRLIVLLVAVVLVMVGLGLLDTEQISAFISSQINERVATQIEPFQETINQSLERLGASTTVPAAPPSVEGP